MYKNTIAILLTSLLFAACTSQNQESATLVITDSKVWTGDSEQPWAEAVAVTDERIIAVGSAASMEPLISETTKVISIDGSLLLPGFIDTHVHFLEGGRGLASVQLRDARTPVEFSQRVADFAKTIEPGEWILNGDWDHQNWGGELPRREWIDATTPDNPVWISRLDGHMGLANSLALNFAGVDADSPDIEGGTIVRDDSGSPTGVLKDNAMRLAVAAIPEATHDQLDRHLAAATGYVASHGVTTVHDVSAGGTDGWASLATYRRAEQNNKLITRIYAIPPLSDWEQVRDDVVANGRGNDWLKTGGVKGMMDGSLGSHTAAFFEPFTDTPEDSGFLLHPLEDMRKWITGADAAGLHVNVHAIGDRAIRDLLDIYYEVAKKNGDRDRRFRIEHAQHIHPDDMQRFAIQNVIASVQPYHAIDDGRWAEDVIGAERAKTTYAFRSLIDSGAHVAFGSDWSVAPAVPLEGIYAAVMRQTLDGANPGGWVPEQKITVEQALHAYTYEGAFASFEENEKGAIKAGMLADMVLLDRDITSIAPEAIRDARVLYTIVGGKVVFSQ